MAPKPNKVIAVKIIAKMNGRSNPTVAKNGGRLIQGRPYIKRIICVIIRTINITANNSNDNISQKRNQTKNYKCSEGNSA